MDLKKVKNIFLSFTGKKPLSTAKTSNMEEVCVFPLPNVVLFPGSVLPLHIFEDQYKLMTDDILLTNRFLAMSYLKPSPTGELSHSVICGAGKVGVVTSYPDGRKDIFVEGRARLKIVKYIQQKPYIRALAEKIPDVLFSSAEEESAFLERLGRLVKRWIFLSPHLEDRFIEYVNLFTRPHHLADFVGFYFLPTTEEKQNLLEMTERKKRVEKITAFVVDQIQKLEGRNELDLVCWNQPLATHH